MSTLITSNITPSAILPKKEFVNKFNILDPEQREITRTLLYSSLQSCLLDSEKRIINGYPDRYDDIISWQKEINLPSDLMNDQLPARSDEQILLRVEPSNRIFYPAKYLSSRESEFLFKLIEIYINSSRIEKIAILQFLQDRKSGSDIIQINTHNQVSSITQ